MAAIRHRQFRELIIDLVMWTLNGSRTLRQSLLSIDRAIPSANICHRIVVDGGSRDNTESIAGNHGWKVFQTTRGISIQANSALEKVDTAFYASFEQDIILSTNWFSRMARIVAHPNVAVAQGVRIATGSKVLEAINRWTFDRHELSRAPVSIDNNLYKTEVIRSLGGYPTPIDNNSWPDGLLYDKVIKHGHQWVIDPNCISGHLRQSYWAHLRHEIGFAQRRVWEYSGERQYQRLSRLLFSPIRGAQIAVRYHTPSALIGYPLFRYSMSTVALRAQRLSRARDASIGTRPRDAK